MKFTVNTKELLKALSQAVYVAATNKNIPQIENVLFNIEGETLTLISTDLEVTSQIQIPIYDNTDTFSVIVPVMLMTKTMEALPDIPITIEIDKETLAINISYGEDIFNMVGYASDTFPQIPSLISKLTITLKGKDVLDAIKSTVFATESKDDMRPYSNCVSIQIKKDILFYATNGNMLSKYVIPENIVLDSKIPVEYNIPKKAILAISKYITAEDEDVIFSFNQSNLKIEIENTHVLYTKLKETKYPSVESVIPKDNNIDIKISKKEFLQAIKNISLYCNESTNQIKIEIKNEELLLTAENIDIKKKAVIKLPCESENANITIGFNHKLLSTIVSICKHEYVHLLLDSPSRAALIKDDANERCTMLLMPVMLNN